jgi:hypothetical protein
MMDNGEISATAVAEMCLCYMSEDDVKDMMLANDIVDEDDNYDFDLEAGEDFADGYDGQPDEAQEWHDFDPDC